MAIWSGFGWEMLWGIFLVILNVFCLITNSVFQTSVVSKILGLPQKLLAKNFNFFEKDQFFLLLQKLKFHQKYLTNF